MGLPSVPVTMAILPDGVPEAEGGDAVSPEEPLPPDAASLDFFLNTVRAKTTAAMAMRRITTTTAMIMGLFRRPLGLA
jgi:hypothetical protein